LFNSSVVDLNGDGVKELYSFTPRSLGPADPVPSDRLFKLSGGTYVVDRPVISLWSLERTNSAPTTLTSPIGLPEDARAPFTLRVINGAGPSAGTRVESSVESGRIWLNGQEIVRPSDFGAQVALIEKTVALQPSNELSVRLAGTPGGRITIVIEAANWVP
jgi:hypothetical protein